MFEKDQVMGSLTFSGFESGLPTYAQSRFLVSERTFRISTRKFRLASTWYSSAFLRPTLKETFDKTDVRRFEQGRAQKLDQSGRPMAASVNATGFP